MDMLWLVLPGHILFLCSILKIQLLPFPEKLMPKGYKSSMY